MRSEGGSKGPNRYEPIVPYGGDVAVARSMAVVHVRNPWTGRCRACREVYPCPERVNAEAVLDAARQTRSGDRSTLTVLVLLLSAFTITALVVFVAVSQR